jgi:pyruvate/2-oxoglutarate dehydrogenase complex dihydrolipoamide acyltransferase (E2) component
LGFNDRPTYEERPAPSSWLPRSLSDIEEEEEEEVEAESSLLMQPPTAAERAAKQEQLRYLEWQKNMAKRAEKRRRRLARQAGSTVGVAAGKPAVSRSFDEQVKLAMEDSMRSENARRAAAGQEALVAPPAPPQPSQLELVRLYGHEDWISHSERDPGLDAYRKSLVEGLKDGSPYNSFAALLRNRDASPELLENHEGGPPVTAVANADIVMVEDGGNGGAEMDRAYGGELGYAALGEVADSEVE